MDPFVLETSMTGISHCSIANFEMNKKRRQICNESDNSKKRGVRSGSRIRADTLVEVPKQGSLYHTYCSDASTSDSLRCPPAPLRSAGRRAMGRTECLRQLSAEPYSSQVSTLRYLTYFSKCKC